MKEKDLKLLSSFILRTGMYTVKENKDTISAFIHGYEIGRDNNCNFIESLVESIEKEYKVESKATGWVGQIEMLAEKFETDWVAIFKKESLKIIVGEFNESSKEEFIESIKKRINGKVGGVRYHFRKDWITDWFGIVDLTANWFREIWSDKELKLLTGIENELKNFGNVQSIKEGIKPTEKLQNICSELYVQMDKNKASANKV